ncbi:hypothetical protein ACFL6C_10565 [Myxococcota bacterium]
MRKTGAFWVELVARYLEVQNEQDLVTFAAAAAVSCHALRWWLTELTVAGSAANAGSHRRRRVWAPRGSQTRARLERQRIARRQSAGTQLSPPEQAILRELGHDRCNSVEVIAQRHWSRCANPLRQAKVTIRRLENRGFVTTAPAHSHVVYLTRAGAREAGVKHPARMHPRHLHHHLATLQALEQYREKVEAMGSRFVDIKGPRGEPMPYQMEMHVQAMQRGGGRRPRRGHIYGVAPDAVVHVAMPNGAVQRVAIEYFTSAYSDSQIREKAELQRRYDVVVQVSDNATTAARVQMQTGLGCGVLE